MVVCRATRGACSHARVLRAALKQGTVPDGFVLEA
jgi:hypothetical protein